MSELDPILKPAVQEQEHQTFAWGGVTDPSDHDPESFRYLVHAINPFAQMNALLITAYDARDGIQYDKAWGDQSISMYDHPERIADRVSLSTSLIDQDHTGTWGEAGLILEAPEPNVVLTSKSDIGAHNNNLDFLLKQADDHGVMDGDSLLQYSYPGSYNEVVTVANRDGSKVQLKGFFFKALNDGSPYNRQLAQRMQMHASRLGLPVVAITEQSPFAKDEVQIHDDKTAIHFNGHRYLIDGYDDSNFRAYDERHASRFTAPHEIETALGFAVSSGNLSQDQADTIMQNYLEADRRRQKPKISYDEDGSIKEIGYNGGYGAGEYKVSIGKNGHANRTNLARQAEAMQSSMLVRYQMSTDPYENYTPLSPSEADRIVDDAVAELSPEEAMQVRTWFNSVRSTTEKQWSYFTQHRSSRFGYESSDIVGTRAEWGALPVNLTIARAETPETRNPQKAYPIKKDIDLDTLLGSIKKNLDS